jgi:hypothetical protein
MRMTMCDAYENPAKCLESSSGGNEPLEKGFTSYENMSELHPDHPNNVYEHPGP